MADTLDLMRARRVAMSEAAICERNKALEAILRWCDRGGEEPEGLCLHEIENICRKQLGLELLQLAKPWPQGFTGVAPVDRPITPGFEGEIPNRRNFEELEAEVERLKRNIETVVEYMDTGEGSFPESWNIRDHLKGALDGN